MVSSAHPLEIPSKAGEPTPGENVEGKQQAEIAHDVLLHRSEKQEVSTSFVMLLSLCLFTLLLARRSSVFPHLSFPRDAQRAANR